MPDIAMCVRQECPSRDKCYRYTATPSDFWQSYFAPPFSTIQDGKCECFWDNAFQKPSQSMPSKSGKDDIPGEKGKKTNG